MKHKLDLKSFTLGAIIVTLVALTVGAVENKNAVPVEYKVVVQSPLPISHSMNQEFLAGDLNRYAAEGWETVCSQLIYDRTEDDKLVRETILKRTKR